MQHVWIVNKDFVPHDGFYKEMRCSRCGMIKTLWSTKSKGRRIFDALIERSGTNFGFISERTFKPECLDWNDNSLD